VHTRNIAHQIVKSVSCHLACSIQINAVKTLHDLGVIRDLKIRNNRFAKLLDLHIAGIILADRYGRINDVRDRHHDLGNFLLKFLFFFL